MEGEFLSCFGNTNVQSSSDNYEIQLNMMIQEISAWVIRMSFCLLQTITC